MIAPVVWPYRMFIPRSQTWGPVASSIDGARPLGGGSPHRVRFGGGGLVMAKLDSIHLNSRKQLATWRSIALQLDGGAGQIEVPCTQGRIRSVGFSCVPHSDGTSFDDSSLYASGMVSASALSAASYRDVDITIRLIGAEPLIGGECFAIRHETVGWRLYWIAAVNDVSGSGSTLDYDVTIRPPLRAAVAAGDALEVSLPRCLMRLADADAMDLTVDLNRFSDPSVSFVEDEVAVLVAMGGPP